MPVELIERAFERFEKGTDSDDLTTVLVNAEVDGTRFTDEEVALFSTLANQTALAVLGGHGDEIIVEADAHVLHYEGAAAAAIAGVADRVGTRRAGRRCGRTRP